ncbi:MAG: thioesterase family protein [Bacteroidota bacterium]
MNDLKLEDFPFITFDKVRYSDTDRQGHVNNAVFSVFLETGRVEFLYHPEHVLLNEGATFVIASLELMFENEIHWPGKVDIGTGIVSIGRSSMKLYQRIFQEGKAVGQAQTVIVQVAPEGKSKPLDEEAKAKLSKWMLNLES